MNMKKSAWTYHENGTVEFKPFDDFGSIKADSVEDINGTIKKFVQAAVRAVLDER